MQGKFNLSAMDEDAWLTRKRLIMSHITSKGQAERYLQVWYCCQLPAAAHVRPWAQSDFRLQLLSAVPVGSVKRSVAAVWLHHQHSLQELDGVIQQTLAGLGSDGSPFSMHTACRG